MIVFCLIESFETYGIIIIIIIIIATIKGSEPDFNSLVECLLNSE